MCFYQLLFVHVPMVLFLQGSFVSDSLRFLKHVLFYQTRLLRVIPIPSESWFWFNCWDVFLNFAESRGDMVWRMTWPSSLWFLCSQCKVYLVEDVLMNFFLGILEGGGSVSEHPLIQQLLDLFWLIMEVLHTHTHIMTFLRGCKLQMLLVYLSD